MYILNNRQPIKLNDITFKELEMQESDVEDIIRQNIDLLCDDEESMLIVGQQVTNEQNGRSDLTAIDNEGGIVLIEIKRDMDDILRRREPFEFQAIRYAASCATIKSTEALIQDIFAPYVEKHKGEFPEDGGLTSSEIAQRQLRNFFEKNDIKAFNQHQRIILTASEFDEQTLSAVAWLNSNQVDISCYQIRLYRHGSDVFLDMDKILPVSVYEDFYVNIASKGAIAKGRRSITRRSLPKIDTLMEWGIVKAGDVLQAKDTGIEAVLQANGQVRSADGAPLSLQAWLKEALGWASVATYDFTVDKKTGRSLSDLRQERMEQNARQESEASV